MLATRASKYCYTALDFETTGTTKGYPSLPWQIGAIEFRIGEPLSNAFFLDSLLYVPSDYPFSKNAPGTHQQQRTAIAAAPTFETLWPVLHAQLSKTIPVAHNASTERNILLHFAPITHYPYWIDTLPLTRRIYPNLPSYALEDLIPLLGLKDPLTQLLPSRKPHDAYYDALACALLLQHLLSLPGWDGIPLSEIISSTRHYNKK